MSTCKYVNKAVLTLVRSETADWLNSASPEEIALALDFGRAAAVECMRRSQPDTIVTPVVAGQIGERQVEQLLRDAFPTVVNTAKVSKCGDMSLWIEHRKVIIEVKNYTNPVPTLGVEKFQRDLATSGAAAGVFVSLRSPITGITDSFTIRCEYVDGRSIPAAYICSDVPAAIVLAVNMVMQLVGAYARSQIELYDRDQVLGGIYAIDAGLNDMAKSRNTLHANIGDMVAQLFKATSGLAANEETLRKHADKIKMELVHTEVVCGGNGENTITVSPLASCQWYAKYSPNTHKQIAHIVAAVEAKDNAFKNTQDLIPATWKCAGTRCIHTTGIGFHMYSGRIEVIIPRQIAREKISLILPLQISTSSHAVNIVLDHASYDTIVQIICDYV